MVGVTWDLSPDQKYQRDQHITTNKILLHLSHLEGFSLGADHLISGGGGLWFFVKKKIVQQIFENK